MKQYSILQGIVNTLFVLVLASCGFIGCTLTSNTNSNGRDDYSVLDTVSVRSSDGVLTLDQTPIKGRLRTFVLSVAGDQAVFYQGEQVGLITSNIDFSQYTIQTTTDKSTNEVTMKVVSLNEIRVYLQRKCDVVEIFNVSQLPQIEIAPGLSPEQIIITPRFEKIDKKCYQVGYQIRYGSEENGCSNQAKKVLQDFKGCTSSEPKRRSTSSCLRALFGVPCK